MIVHSPLHVMSSNVSIIDTTDTNSISGHTVFVLRQFSSFDLYVLFLTNLAEGEVRCVRKKCSLSGTRSDLTLLSKSFCD